MTCGKHAHAGSRTRVTSMGGLYDTVTLHARGGDDPMVNSTETIKQTYSCSFLSLVPGSCDFLRALAMRVG